MRQRVTIAAFVLIVAWRVIPAASQGAGQSPKAGDWPLHNYDVRNSRYFPADEINTSNADKLTLKWSFQVPGGDSIASATPLVVDGVMYVNSGSSLFAVDAASGRRSFARPDAP